MKGDDALAGYHMYWTPPIVSIAGVEAKPTGPLRDERGRPMVVPPGFDFDDPTKPAMVPGKYVLVPIDARGRELPGLPTIEKVVVDPLRALAMQSVITEATMLVLARSVNDARLALGFMELMQSADKQGVMLKAMQQASTEIWGGDLPAEPLEPERHRRLVAATTDRIIAGVYALLEKDDPQRFRLDRESFDALIRQPLVLSVDHLMASAGRADFEDAAVRALAKLYIGEELPFWFVADILPGLERLDLFLVLIRFASGDRIDGLTRLLDEEKFADGIEGSESRAMAIFALWILGNNEAVRPTVLRWVRRTLRQPLTVRSVGLLL